MLLGWDHFNMTKPTFTPGPWKVEEDGDESVVVGTSPVSSPIVAWVNTTKGTETQPGCCGNPEANANLIAAAPELYEALETLLKHHSGPQPVDNEAFETVAKDVEQARAVLAKARGEE